MLKKLIVANWKMAPESLAQAEEILDAVNGHIVSEDRDGLLLVFCPPFVFIEEVAKMLSGGPLGRIAALGAQDIAVQDTGAFTGEISGTMLTKLGVRYVIVGHSERRWKLGESDKTVNDKLKAVLRNGLVPIVCLGERTRGGDWEGFLREQVVATFGDLSSGDVSRCIVAYEPVWAISTTPDAQPDTPKSALEAIGVIKDVLATNYKLQTICCLYGGSVASHNAAGFVGVHGIDGVLVGGASVRKEEFVKIISIAYHQK